MPEDLQGRQQLLYLWQEQDGLCPICHQKITKLTETARKVQGVYPWDERAFYRSLR